MPTQISERDISDREMKLLLDWARDVRERRSAYKELIVQGLGVWFSILMMLLVLWGVVTWLVRLSTGFDVGWNSTAGPWGFGVCALLLAVYVATAMVRSRPKTSLLQADLDSNKVLVEAYQFSAAMRMQEQEHGGLMYFLHTDDGSVFVLFDYESQDLGVDGKDPLTSAFEPRTRLRLVRAPISGRVLETTFSGDALDAGDPLVMTAPPAKWPEFEQICDTPWEKLEARFCNS